MIVNSLNVCDSYSKYAQLPIANHRVLQNNFSFKNLQPLNKDTVSFSGSKEYDCDYISYKPDLHHCSKISKYAKNSELGLRDALENYLGHINEGFSDNEKPITITTRVKEPLSIQEKVLSKFAKIDKDNKKLFGDDLYKILFDYFEPKKGQTKDSIEKRIQKISGNMYDFIGVPPYKHEKEYLEYYINKLEYDDFIELKESAQSRNSVIEEMTKRLEKNTNKDFCEHNKGKYIDTEDYDGIKYYAKDIVGARIVLNDSSVETVQKVLDGLRRAANNGAFNIVSVENHLPSAKKLPQGKKQSDYEYIPSCRLRRFTDDTDSIYDKKNSPSGYTAIHVNIDLSDDTLRLNKGKIKDRNKYNGFFGEIQIIDRNVKTLKEVEDLCYKLKDNKNSFKPKYKPFKEYFNYDEQSKEVRDAFSEYTFKSYLLQRERTMAGNNNCPLPQISDFNFEHIQDESFKKLDFNKLLMEKCKCDMADEEHSVEIYRMFDFEKKKNESFFGFTKRMIQKGIDNISKIFSLWNPAA